MRWLPLLLVLAMILGALPGRAVILFGTGDPEANTTPPGGDLADSGWQFQITANAGGTVVGPSHVLTARHLGFASNSIISFAGLKYRVMEHADAPDSDLRLLRVAGRFPEWAPILTTSNEVGRSVVLFGRGGPRGSSVSVTTPTTVRPAGWLWLASDARLRWGTNRIEQVVEGTADSAGIYLAAWFDSQGGGDEATVSPGDSGGGVFLRDDDGSWKLAGVMSSVEGVFRRSLEENFFYGAVFDRRNLLEELTPGEWSYDPERFNRPGSAWYATRVSAYHDWLVAELAREPVTPLPRLLRAPSVEGPYEEHPAYAVETATRSITLLRGPETGGEFYRTEGEPALQFSGLAGDVIILQY